MKIRSPFKDKWGRWRDDITQKQKNIWTFISVVVGILIARMLGHLGVFDWIIEVISP